MEVSYTSRLTGYGSPSLAAADEETEFVLHALYALLGNPGNTTLVFLGSFKRLEGNLARALTLSGCRSGYNQGKKVKRLKGEEVIFDT